MQKGRPKENGPEIGQVIWFFKNPDHKNKGILFGKIINKSGSDFVVEVSTGGITTIPPQRIRLIEGMETSIPQLRRDNSYQQDRLVDDVEKNPGPISDEDSDNEDFEEKIEMLTVRKINVNTGFLQTESDSCQMSKQIRMDLTQNHLFRYPSEVDPRKVGTTKGGYIEGTIFLPSDNNLKLTLSTFSNDQDLLNIHPTLIHVVRKGAGNRRQGNLEPVPQKKHWKQEFIIENKKVYILNRTSKLDKIRDIKPIEEKEELFPLKQDNAISLGKGLEELNLVILMPKSTKRARGEDISVDMLLKNRTNDPTILQMLNLKYTGKILQI